jgi:hypothetical protein
MGKKTVILIASLFLVIIILGTCLYVLSIPLGLNVQPLTKQEDGKEWISWKITGHLKPGTGYRIWVDTWLNGESHASLGNWSLGTNMLGDFDFEYFGWWSPPSGNISGNHLVQVRVDMDNSLALQKDFNFTIS